MIPPCTSFQFIGRKTECFLRQFKGVVIHGCRNVTREFELI